MSDLKTRSAPQGQINVKEAELPSNAITNPKTKSEAVLEFGTRLGGRSTVYVLRTLEKNGAGHLWGIEYFLCRETHQQNEATRTYFRSGVKRLPGLRDVDSMQRETLSTLHDRILE